MPNSQTELRTPYTNAAGIELDVVQMSPVEMEGFLTAIILESQFKKDQAKFSAEALGQARAAALKEDTLMQILEKRVEAFNLPIKFTLPALLAATCLATNPGRIIALAVDCCTRFDPGDGTIHEVTVENLTDLYPFGFYSEEAFGKYVDEYLKPKKIKWSKIY